MAILFIRINTKLSQKITILIFKQTQKSLTVYLFTATWRFLSYFFLGSPKVEPLPMNFGDIERKTVPSIYLFLQLR